MPQSLGSTTGHLSKNNRGFYCINPPVNACISQSVRFVVSNDNMLASIWTVRYLPCIGWVQVRPFEVPLLKLPAAAKAHISFPEK